MSVHVLLFGLHCGGLGKVVIVLFLHFIYRIVENFEGKNFRISVQNENFTEKTFADCFVLIIVWVWLQNFAEKTYTDGSETVKNVNVFSLKSFPLYSSIQLFMYYLVHSNVPYPGTLGPVSAHSSEHSSHVFIYTSLQVR